MERGECGKKGRFGGSFIMFLKKKPMKVILYLLDACVSQD